MKIMKKTFILVIAAAFALGTVGCGNSAITKKQNEIIKMPDAELRQEIVENNDMSKVVAGGEYAVMEVNIINLQDEYKYKYKWVVGDQFFYFSSDGSELVFDHGEEYGMFEGNTFYSVKVFDDELLEAEYDTMCKTALSKYIALDSERGVLVEKDGENIKYVTLASIEDFGEEYCSAVGIDSTKCREIKDVCVLDTNTLRILDAKKYMVDVNGEELLYSINKQQFLSENPNKEEVAALREKCLGGENYNIKIIVGQGTDREKVYETTINKDACLDLWVRDAEGYYTVYTDPELTNEYPYDENDMLKFSGDMTLYMK